MRGLLHHKEVSEGKSCDEAAVLIVMCLVGKRCSMIGKGVHVTAEKGLWWKMRETGRCLSLCSPPRMTTN